MQTPVQGEEKAEAVVSPSAPTLFEAHTALEQPPSEADAEEKSEGTATEEAEERPVGPPEESPEPEVTEDEDARERPPATPVESAEQAAAEDGAESEEESPSFDATLPESTLDNLAGDLEQPDEEVADFGATLEDNQLSLLAGDLDDYVEVFIPQIPAVQEDETPATESREDGLVDEREPSRMHLHMKARMRLNRVWNQGRTLFRRGGIAPDEPEEQLPDAVEEDQEIPQTLPRKVKSQRKRPLVATRMIPQQLKELSLPRTARSLKRKNRQVTRGMPPLLIPRCSSDRG